MRIIFVRHGESEGNVQGKIQGREDYRLSITGVCQAERLKKFFSKQMITVTHLYSSPLIRAVQTAEILSGLWKVQIKIEPGLQEYDMGRLSGVDKATLKEKIPEVRKHQRDSRNEYFDRIQPKNLLGIEAFSEARKRAQSTMGIFFQRHDDSDVILCVSHGGILQRFVEEVLGTKKMWKTEIKNTAIFDFELQCPAQETNDKENLRDNIIVNKINLFNYDSHFLGN